MNSKQRVLRTLQGEETDRVPVIPLIGVYGEKFIDSTPEQAITDPEIQYKSLKTALDRFQYDGVITWMDLTIEAEALGLERTFPQDKLPSIVEHPVSGREDLRDLPSTPVKASRMDVFVKTAQKLTSDPQIQDSKFTAGYITGPFSLAGQLRGVENLLKDFFQDEEFVHENLSFCTDFLESYAARLAEPGLDSIIVLEPTASGSLVSPHQFEEYVAPYLTRLHSAIRENQAAPGLHICGNAQPILSQMEDTAPAVISIGPQVDLETAREETDLTIIGNLDPTETLYEKTPDEIRQIAEERIKLTGGEKFILSSGCDVVQSTPEANLRAMQQAVK